MGDAIAELGFDALLSLATGITLGSYMLGVVLDPLAAAAVGVGLVSLGVLTLVPPAARATVGVLGVTAVGLAGILVPRAVTTFVAVPAGNELVVSLVGSGLVLLLTFALVRMTAFHDRPEVAL